MISCRNVAGKISEITRSDWQFNNDFHIMPLIIFCTFRPYNLPYGVWKKFNDYNKFYPEPSKRLAYMVYRHIWYIKLLPFMLLLNFKSFHQILLNGPNCRGRPKMSWIEVINRDMKELGRPICKENAIVRARWRRLILSIGLHGGLPAPFWLDDESLAPADPGLPGEVPWKRLLFVVTKCYWLLIGLAGHH